MATINLDDNWEEVEEKKPVDKKENNYKELPRGHHKDWHEGWYVSLYFIFASILISIPLILLHFIHH